MMPASASAQRSACSGRQASASLAEGEKGIGSPSIERGRGAACGKLWSAQSGDTGRTKLDKAVLWRDVEAQSGT